MCVHRVDISYGAGTPSESAQTPRLIDSAGIEIQNYPLLSLRPRRPPRITGVNFPHDLLHAIATLNQFLIYFQSS